MKYLIAMIMMLILAVPVASAQVFEPGYTAVDTVAAMTAPATAKSIKMERMCCGDYNPDKKTPEQIGYSKVVSIGGRSSNGVLGGNTVGIIRS